MRRLLVLLLLVPAMVLSLGASASAVNDPVVPGEDCAASETPVGHPANANQADNPQGANPPFSSNNPGQSTGARGQERSQAVDHCAKAEDE
jgi:hypothetical protein